MAGLTEVILKSIAEEGEKLGDALMKQDIPVQIAGKKLIDAESNQELFIGKVFMLHTDLGLSINKETMNHMKDNYKEASPAFLSGYKQAIGAN
ncbi:hypothetical protein [Bacillus arachidis]|uniref:hypothetical protein n=1 Tax=Bacillus arachidis TaxID=2819290 RepID=UPI00255CC217|nr:hypothetical protein [Bacillus arachidis]WIY58934.1 hypothetical protein QRY57_00475 [Bacillus arachidis]